MFITALTSVRHLSLSWTSPIQSIYPHPTSWRSILILSTHLRLGLPSGHLPSGFPTKTLYTPLSSPIRATCPAHLILLNFMTRTILGEQYKSNLSLCDDQVPVVETVTQILQSTSWQQAVSPAGRVYSWFSEGRTTSYHHMWTAPTLTFLMPANLLAFVFPS